MSHNPTEMTLFLEVDLTGSVRTPRVKNVNVGTNMHLSTKPGIAILATVDAGNLSESSFALAALIRDHPRYAWVKAWPDIATFLDQWDPRLPPTFPSYRSLGGGDKP